MTNTTAPVNNPTNISFTAFAAMSKEVASLALYSRRSGYVHTQEEIELAARSILGAGWELWIGGYLVEYQEALEG